ncbi:30S ribosomal protein S6 [candidate division WWE3 bacterium RIFCSPHIGHO2_12_FULL_38_15]|uniref:Small ribosomal subunit protein bS6 n=1 Tax=candidate division WWE3 bacterium RIFCSPHIGHO2_02_FULL_38_14 TaxID=1802620 RepID=A0A1F4V734_UNCKA|nr:MAG: 30S ribosomal protein S6 [candidate division WWE3 bacterium RIFCSPHIGHO2_01_FULL_38_45]OGC48871.1 MAG: 30S ribosomal protein S6 [candidate division WWE3 bacterium RIFCSPHIGHO2_12_FULL_38_15]OGC53018.1 MAG: 30S ribosomal protein S6 [candidate division WWE3 bacterium RIFCSPHIGHO2_02_FULL_38_14]OGC53174.1 MAG: 30S ribosomal protein S6 [candidate division WWE3 bacterium RIFCSPLOWO2_01_FULL_37_24]HLB52019.1 30S ribosomal protein S6 [Patescibacteria group bacterium]
MRKYEIMTIAKSKLGEDGSRNLSNSVKDLVSSFKGTVLDNNFMGKRKLAYPLKRESEAFYDVINFELEPAELSGFKTKLNLVDDLLRYLITAK